MKSHHSTPCSKAGPMVVALALFSSAAAQAQSLAEVRSLLRADRIAEALALADKRLAAEPHHLEALVGRVEALLRRPSGTGGPGDNKRLDMAIETAELCVQQHPKAALCHNAIGDALGTKALSAGMVTAMRLAGRVREAYQKAVGLDAQLPEARFSLLQYYLQAPAIVGGGMDKARELANESARLLPQDGPLFQALVALSDKKWDEAERLVLSVKAAADSDTTERQNSILEGLGFVLLQEKKPADSQRVFAQLQSRDPRSALAAFGSGRAAQEQGQHAQAIAHYERAIALKPAAHHHFRMAQCHQAAGNQAAALAAYERALAFKPPLSDKQRSEATEQVTALKAGAKG